MTNSIDAGRADHVFLGAGHERNEHRTWIVIGITFAMMAIEIAAGTIFGSMALVADGWHMSTHACALLIAALAYLFARRHVHDPRFAFGTGKLGDLAAFASAIVLGIVAALIAWESLTRLVNPGPIDFPQATLVAVIGLVVNLVCAWLLRDDHRHGHDHHHHGHDHDHHGHADHAGPERDNNLRSAYMHVVADALTSVLAIVALLLGGAFGWVWLDPVIGIAGAIVIGYWSLGLIRAAGGVLVDYSPDDAALCGRIRDAIEALGDTVTDIHVWRLGPGHRGAVIAIRSASPRNLAAYRAQLAAVARLSHLTVEVETA